MSDLLWSSARESIAYVERCPPWLHRVCVCVVLTVVDSELAVVFDAMDFDSTEQISMDEMVRLSRQQMIAIYRTRKG